MSIAINSNYQRDQLVCNTANQTVFAYSFPILAASYLTVYLVPNGDTPDDRTQRLTLNTDYTVQGAGDEAGGTITLVTGASVGDVITIVGTEPIERLTVFEDYNPFTVALNEQLNALTVMMNQNFTYWHNMTPHYNNDELVNNEVRPQKLILPMLPNGHVWVGRGELGDDPDDIITALLSSSGTGNVISSGDPMRQSIAVWTGAGTVITDSDININGSIFEQTAGSTTDRTGFDDAWGAMHWPAHDTAGRPALPQDGDTYYDTDENLFYGYLNGAWVSFGTSSGNNNPVTITQANTFNPGDWLYIEITTGTYKLADASTIPTAEAVVIVLSATPTSFVAQEVGYIAASLDVFGSTLTPGTIYFLSDTNPGEMQANIPVTQGFVAKALFYSDSTNSGWILDYPGYIIGQFPSPAETIPVNNVETITQPAPDTLAVGDVIYLDTDEIYKKGIATSLATSQVEWVVTDIPAPDTYTIQQGGKVTGVITTDAAGAAMVSGQIYYLSPTVAGKLTTTAPTTPGQYTKPFYVQTVLATNKGWLLDQRPLPITAAGSNAEVLIQTITLNNDSDVTVSNLFDGTYKDIRIVGRNIVVRDTVANAYYATAPIIMWVETGGVLRQVALGGTGYAVTDALNSPFPGTWANCFNLQRATAVSAAGVNTYTCDVTAYTDLGTVLTFDVYMYGVNATTTYKQVKYECEYYDSVPGGGLGNFWGTRNVLATANYVGNKLDITGFRICFYPDETQTRFVFYSGEVSIYGVVA